MATAVLRGQASTEYLPALLKGRDACDALTHQMNMLARRVSLVDQGRDMRAFPGRRTNAQLHVHPLGKWPLYIGICSVDFWHRVSGKVVGILQEYVRAGTTEVAWAWRGFQEEHLRSRVFWTFQCPPLKYDVTELEPLEMVD